MGRLPLIRALAAALLCLGFSFAAQAQAPAVNVFAASSLTEALNDVGAAYAAHHHVAPVFNYAASSALAHQIEQGANADLFVSADEDWMNYLQQRNLIDAPSRVSLLTNRLVLIAPSDHPLRISIRPHFNLAGALAGGHLAMADPDSVPAGRYGRAALTSLGVWDAVSPLVVRGENVRAALRFVETGDAAAGIVYATDAQASTRVVVAGVFPENTHPPITYPAAIVAGHVSDATTDFAHFLRSPEAHAIFRRHGFGVR